jgi:hypothetical protein
MNNGFLSSKAQTRTYFTGAYSGDFSGTVLQPLGTKYHNDTNAAITVNTVGYQPSEIMLENNQIGIYNQNELAIDATTTAAQLASFFIAQKRNTLLDGSSLPSRPAEKSEMIPVNAKMQVSARMCAVDINNSWVIGVDNAGTTGKINTNENTVYGITIAHKGQWANRMNARNNAATFPQFEVEGTWAELGIALEVDRRDYIAQNLVYMINRESRLWNQLESQPVVAIAVDNTTVAAGAIVTLNSLVVGDVITIAYKNGNTAEPINLTITNGIYQAIQTAITNGVISNTAVIIPANPSTAGDTTYNVDQIFMLALDRGIVETDRKISVKYRFTPGLTEGFTNFVSVLEGSKPFEGIGLPRQIRLDYEEYAELNKAWRVQNPSGNAFQYPQDIIPTYAYTVIQIEWLQDQQGTNSYFGGQPELITIAIPCCDGASLTAWEDLLNGFFKALPNCRFFGSHLDAAGDFDITGVTTPCTASLGTPFVPFS